MTCIKANRCFKIWNLKHGNQKDAFSRWRSRTLEQQLILHYLKLAPLLTKQEMQAPLCLFEIEQPGGTKNQKILLNTNKKYVGDF